MSRAENRHFAEREKIRVRDRLSRIFHRLEHDPEHYVTPATVGIHARTPVLCSDPFCCGNPRRFNGQRTVQERRCG